MKTIGIVTFAALICLTTFQASACDCMHKTQLDAEDWQDAPLIFQAKVKAVESDDSTVHILFEVEDVFKGQDLGDVHSISYPKDAEHPLIHQMEQVSKGQHWIFFTEEGEDGMMLMKSKRSGFCALSRHVESVKRDASVEFLADMRVNATGPKQLFFPDGTLMAEGQFYQGMATGHWVFYDYAGRVIESGRYIEGKRSGPWYRYQLNPATGIKFVCAKDKYDSGRKAEYEEYDHNHLIKSHVVFGGNGEYMATYYDENGDITKTVEQDPAVSYTVHVDYHPSGNIKEVRYTENDLQVRRIEYKESYYENNSYDPTLVLE